MRKNPTETMSDSEMNVHLTAGSGRITEHKWNGPEESDAGTVAVLDKSAGIEGRRAGHWMADGRGGWERI